MTTDEPRDAAIRKVAWHNGRDAAADDLLDWCRENWPVVAHGQHVDSAIWNSMPETLAAVARGEGLGASVARMVQSRLSEATTGGRDTCRSTDVITDDAQHCDGTGRVCPRHGAVQG